MGKKDPHGRYMYISIYVYTGTFFFNDLVEPSTLLYRPPTLLIPCQASAHISFTLPLYNNQFFF